MCVQRHNVAAGEAEVCGLMHRTWVGGSQDALRAIDGPLSRRLLADFEAD